MIFIFFILNLIGLSPPSRIPSPLIIQKLQRCFNDQKFENLILSFPDLRNNFTLYEPYVKISPIVFMPLIFKYDIALSSETINHAFQLLFNTQPSYCSYKDKLLSLIEQFASYTYYRPHLNDILLLMRQGYYKEAIRYRELYYEQSIAENWGETIIGSMSISSHQIEILMWAPSQAVLKLSQQPLVKYLNGWFNRITVLITCYLKKTHEPLTEQELQRTVDTSPFLNQFKELIWKPVNQLQIKPDENYPSLLQKSILTLILNHMINQDSDRFYNRYTCLFVFFINQFSVDEWELKVVLSFLYRHDIFPLLPDCIQNKLNQWVSQNNINISKWTREVFDYFNPIEKISNRCQNYHQGAHSWNTILNSTTGLTKTLNTLASAHVSSFLEMGLKNDKPQLYKFKDSPLPQISPQAFRKYLKNKPQTRWEGRTFVISNGTDCICIKFKKTEENQTCFLREADTMRFVHKVSHSLHIPFSQKLIGQCSSLTQILPKIKEKEGIEPHVHIIYSAKEISFHYANTSPYHSSLPITMQLVAILGGYHGLFYTQLLDFEHFNNRPWTMLRPLLGKRIGALHFWKGTSFPNLTEESMRDTADVFGNFPSHKTQIYNESFDFKNANLNDNSLFSTLFPTEFIYWAHIPSQQALNFFFLHIRSTQPTLMQQHNLPEILCYFFASSIALHNRRNLRSFLHFFKNAYLPLCRQAVAELKSIFTPITDVLTEANFLNSPSLTSLYFIAMDYHILLRENHPLLKDIPQQTKPMILRQKEIDNILYPPIKIPHIHVKTLSFHYA